MAVPNAAWDRGGVGKCDHRADQTHAACLQRDLHHARHLLRPRGEGKRRRMAVGAPRFPAELLSTREGAGPLRPQSAARRLSRAAEGVERFASVASSVTLLDVDLE